MLIGVLDGVLVGVLTDVLTGVLDGVLVGVLGGVLVGAAMVIAGWAASAAVRRWRVAVGDCASTPDVIISAPVRTIVCVNNFFMIKPPNMSNKL
ncbi:MAG TPA: hypothetical protein VJT71_09645 [Pyrinomonadaceae bacterium]|nr:hypothetical protein [Pyrinomonadaceae bacterium]